MNGPSTIYRLQPVYQLPRQLELPTCMYRMKNPVACVTNKSENTENEKEVLTGIMDKVKDILKKPLPELELLEARWDSVLQQLSQLKLQMATIRNTVNNACELSGCPRLDSTTLNNLKVFQGAVVNANPSHPPYSLLVVKHLYKSSVPMLFSTHVHSSVSSLPENVQSFSTPASEAYDNAVKIVLIWKDGITDTELILNPVKQLSIKGEVNILRFLAKSGLKLLRYPSDELVDTIQIDSILDVCHRLLHVKTAKEKSSLYRNLNAKLGKSSYFGKENVNIADISAWSALKQINVNPSQDLTPNMVKWYERMDRILF